MNPKLKIAIDGPAGAGKSTVAREVSRELNLLYVDTGAIYRAVTLAALNLGIDWADERAVAELARKIDIAMVPDDNKLYRVFAFGRDVTDEIRSPRVSRHVSLVARIPEVRENLLFKQRDMARAGGVVMEGRDIGTTVLPEADFKFFLTATAEERARRRYRELVAAGYRVDRETLLQEIQERDRIDSTREIAPLVPAPGAIIIDCSEMSIRQVVDNIVSEVTGR